LFQCILRIKEIVWMSNTFSIFEIYTSFSQKALQTFRLQREHNPVYRRFCEALGVREISSLDEIPLLPISAFKDVEELLTSNTQHRTSKLYFQSSGTSGMVRSRHYIADPEIYRQSIIKGMQHFYVLDDYAILAYTPGYNANPHSSLVWMLNTLIERDASGLSRFLELNQPLQQKLVDEITKAGKKVMLFGAAFGLLDMLELGKIDLPGDSIILETGGMKTFRREMSKEELHQKLASGFGLPESQIHSEYGMTELLSQAYSQGSLWFKPVPWMQVSIRNPQNPMEILPAGDEGLIGVIDLANVHSCAFILTGDKGVQNDAGEFQVLGRWNPVNLRGCNFLIDE
jgi:phenylacetate-coenzyme A ligase PaaK-like adenylate-forming protein